MCREYDDNEVRLVVGDSTLASGKKVLGCGDKEEGEGGASFFLDFRGSEDDELVGG